MTSEHDLINEVFENYLGSGLSSEVGRTIADAYGEETASKVHAIYTEAIHCPVDWQTATIDTALPVLHEFLENKYPWLSREARKKINFAFIMTWK